MTLVLADAASGRVTSEVALDPTLNRTVRRRFLADDMMMLLRCACLSLAFLACCCPGQHLAHPGAERERGAHSLRLPCGGPFRDSSGAECTL